MTFGDSLIVDSLRPFGIAASAELCAKVRAYAELLLRWNQKINLTAITEPREILERHFGESMFGAQAIPAGARKVVDVGSGAGFPGLAVKLVRPELELLLIEPNKKKAAFLAEVCRTIQAEYVMILSVPFESVRYEADLTSVVMTRAFHPSKQFLRWSHERLSADGIVLLWIGREDVGAITKHIEFEWHTPQQIPLSRDRVLLAGSKRLP
jgi:16S rRNA (guanine(527)-N(7))-methyltransferase RsmG